MEIKTRFKKGDKVWFLKDSKVYSGIIEGFNISFDTNLVASPVMIRYYIKAEIGTYVFDTPVWEQQCYLTKQELIESL